MWILRLARTQLSFVKRIYFRSNYAVIHTQSSLMENKTKILQIFYISLINISRCQFPLAMKVWRNGENSLHQCHWLQNCSKCLCTVASWIHWWIFRLSPSAFFTNLVLEKKCERTRSLHLLDLNYHLRFHFLQSLIMWVGMEVVLKVEWRWMVCLLTAWTASSWPTRHHKYRKMSMYDTCAHPGWQHK